MELPLPPEKLVEKFAEHNIHAFLDYYQITNDQGEPLDFHNHPYLWDIYNDWTPKQCAKKSSQVGWSTTSVLKSLWASKTKGMDVIYSFPTFDMARKMVASKVNRLIANNPILQEWTKDQDSAEQKRIGGSMMYFPGCSNEQAAIAYPADLYIADEVDRSDQAIVEQFASRLTHSSYKWEWRFSNPSVPENGVDKWWQESDQKEWFVRCEGCSRDQVLTLEHMKEDKFLCEKCGRELDRRKGRWIKRWSDREISGYHVSSLMNSFITPKEIRKLQKDKSEQYFANFVLGEPYVGSGNYLPRHVLFSNLIDKENPQDAPPVIGVDTGKHIHMVVGNKYGLFFRKESPDYHDLEMILKNDKRAIAVIDKGGDESRPRELLEKYPGQVYLCVFVQAQDVAPKWKEDVGYVNTDRNKAIQLVVDEFTDRRIPIYGSREEWGEYADHWGRLYRVLEEDERGRRRFVWERNGPDHFALATVYWRMGMDKVMGGEGELVGVPGAQLWPGIGMDQETGRITKATLRRL